MMNAWILLIATLTTAAAVAVPAQSDLNMMCKNAMSQDQIQMFLPYLGDANAIKTRKFYVQCYRNTDNVITGTKNKCAPCTVFVEGKGCVDHSTAKMEEFEGLELEVREPFPGRCGSFHYCGVANANAIECCDPLYRFAKEDEIVVFKHDTMGNEPCIPDEACNETCGEQEPSTTPLPYKPREYEVTCERNSHKYHQNAAEYTEDCYSMLKDDNTVEKHMCCSQGKFDIVDCMCLGNVYEKKDCYIHTDFNNGLDETCNSNRPTCMYTELVDGVLVVSSGGRCVSWTLTGIPVPRTVMMFVKMDGVAGKSTLLRNGPGCGDYGTLEMYIEEGALLVRVVDIDGPHYLKTEKGTIEENKWYHVAYTAGGGEQTLYVNGETVDRINAQDVKTSYSSMQIGGRDCWNAAENKKTLDEVTLLKIPLSKDGVAQLYEMNRKKEM